MDEMTNEYYVYIGPSLRGVIQKGAIYTGTRAEVEEFLADAITRFPRIRKLLVSGETLAVDRIEVQTPGTRLYNEYRKLAAGLK